MEWQIETTNALLALQRRHDCYLCDVRRQDFFKQGRIRPLRRPCEYLISKGPFFVGGPFYFHLIHDGMVLKYFLNFLFERQDILLEYSNYKGQRFGASSY